MKKVLAMCLGVMILCVCTPPLRVFAQAKYTVNGVVVDNSGNPIIGASVVEQGTVNGVTTDIDGAFAITVKSRSRLSKSATSVIRRSSAWLRRPILPVWCSKRTLWPSTKWSSSATAPSRRTT